MFGLILCISGSNSDVNCYQNFRCLFMISPLAVALLRLYSISFSMFFVRRYFLYTIFFCYTSCFISSSYIIFFVNALYFPRISSAACVIMVVILFHFQTIFKLSGIPSIFC